MPDLRRLLVADEPDAWEAAGFALVDSGPGGPETRIGSITIRFVGRQPQRPETGIVGWELTDIDDGSIDGIMSLGTDVSAPTPIEHPNRVTRLDHVVVMTPSLERTTSALRAFGFSPRRTRPIPDSDPPRSQVFFWAGDTIFEVVGPDESTGAEPARVWGLALTTDDMDAAATAIGQHLGPAKPAVQPGRHIATVRTKDLDISLTLALLTPHVQSSEPERA